MKIAKLAYLTSPAPNRFILNIQYVDTLGNDALLLLEISKAHLANIVIDGAALSLRESSINRVPEIKQTEDAHDGPTGRQ